MERARSSAGEPLCEIEDDAGEEAGLCHAKQEAHDVELHGQHGDGQQSPGEHDAGQPAARAKADQHEVGEDFEDSVADKEEPGTEAADGRAEVQVAIHLQCGEADVGAVDIRDAISDGEQRQQVHGGLVQGYLAERLLVTECGRECGGRRCVGKRRACNRWIGNRWIWDRWIWDWWIWDWWIEGGGDDAPHFLGRWTMRAGLREGSGPVSRGYHRR
jgi:hypothetical protein